MHISWVNMQTMEPGTILLEMIWAQVFNTLSKLHNAAQRAQYNVHSYFSVVLLSLFRLYYTSCNHFHLPDHLDIVANHFQDYNFQRDGLG